jgi:hypothetical protein
MQRRRRSAAAGDAAALERSSLAESARTAGTAPVPGSKADPRREDETTGCSRSGACVQARPNGRDRQPGDRAFTLTVDNKGKGRPGTCGWRRACSARARSKARRSPPSLRRPARSRRRRLPVRRPRRDHRAGRWCWRGRTSARSGSTGVPLFIPTVVVRVVYQWGKGRSSQVHGTYLVGIENQKVARRKWAPFRLDLGPRIYRSVGGRRSSSRARPGALAHCYFPLPVGRCARGWPRSVGVAEEAPLIPARRLVGVARSRARSDS